MWSRECQSRCSVLDYIRWATDNVVLSETPKNRRQRRRLVLYMRLPDGSARPATALELATAGFQSQLSLAAAYVQELPTLREKLAFAEAQSRNANTAMNKMYRLHQYNQAVDVYLTCQCVTDVSVTQTPKEGNIATSQQNLGTATTTTSTSTASGALRDFSARRDSYVPECTRVDCN